MEDFFTTIANLGFPIAVAAWLLVRMEQKMQALTSAICDLRAAIIKLPESGKEN